VITLKKQFFALFFLIFIFASLFPVTFTYAEKKTYNIEDLVLGANAYFDAKVTYKTSTGLASYSMHLALNAPKLTIDGKPGEVQADPDYQKTGNKEKYAAEEILGSRSYLKKNTTTDLQLTNFNITDDFALSSYYMFYVKNMKTIDTTSTSIIEVAYGNDTSTTYANANKVALINEVVVGQRDYYQDLTFPNPDIDGYTAVVNIRLKNIECDGFYIFSYGAKHFVDSRDMTLWWNSYDTPLTALGEDQPSQNWVKIDATHANTLSGPIKASSIKDLNKTAMRQVPDPSFDKLTDLEIKVFGWTDPDTLEDALYQKWVEAIPQVEDVDDIVDYEILTAHFSFIFSDTALALIKEELEDQYKITDDYHSLVQNTLLNTLPFLALTNIKKPYDIIKLADIPVDSYSTNGFFNNVLDTVKSFGSGVASTVVSVVDRIPDIIDSVGSAAGEVIAPVAQTAQAVSENAAGTVTSVADTAGNMVVNTAGHLTNGIAGVAGAASNLGSNVMKSLKLPLIIIGGVLAVGVIIYVMAFMRPPRII